MPSSLTPDALVEIRDRHVAFLVARLTSAEAEGELRDNLKAVYEALLAAPVGSVVDPSALAAAVDAALTSDAVEHVARPLSRRLLPLILAELRAEPGKVGDRVPLSAQGHLDALLARPALLPERFLREIAELDAVDEIMRDVLYDGFREFSEKVNPFTAEWGIPSLLKRMSVLGGAVAKGLDSVKAEFDRRLEPEIRRFLAGFSRRGLRRMVDVTISRAELPTAVAVRRHLIAWVLDQEIATLARDADPEALVLLSEIGLDVAAAELARPAVRARRRAVIEAAVTARGEQTVAEALADLGVKLHLDHEAVAAALWPVAKVALSSAPVTAWLAKLTAEFYEEESARGKNEAEARGV